MRPSRLVGLKVGLVILAALLLQMAVVADLQLLGAVGDLLLVVTVAAALADGPDRGATIGFAAGVAYDLVLDTPFGLSALVYAIVGFVVGMAGAKVGTAGWSPVGLAALSGMVAMALYAGIGHLVGHAYPLEDLPAIALIVAAWNAALVLPVTGVMRRILGRNRPESIHLAVR